MTITNVPMILAIASYATKDDEKQVKITSLDGTNKEGANHFNSYAVSSV
jgi:hypothetical protein